MPILYLKTYAKIMLNFIMTPFYEINVAFFTFIAQFIIQSKSFADLNWHSMRHTPPLTHMSMTPRRPVCTYARQAETLRPGVLPHSTSASTDLCAAWPPCSLHAHRRP